MKKILALATLAIFISAPSPAIASMWPWLTERPRGVELEGLLDVDGNLSVSSYGSSLICTQRREPVLKREWMFEDSPPIYDWQEPLQYPFEYVNAPSSNFVKIKVVSLPPENAGMTVHVRQNRKTYRSDGRFAPPTEHSQAWSYGEVEIKAATY